MAQDHSFDIVSQVDFQELRNAVQMAGREVAQRYDFKGSSAAVELRETERQVILTADHDLQMRNLRDLFELKLTKRGIAVNALGATKRQIHLNGQLIDTVTIQTGIPQEQAKAIVKTIKELKLKVQASIQGDQIRVSGRKIDELQTVIQTLRRQDFGLPLQFTNQR